VDWRFAATSQQRTYQGTALAVPQQQPVEGL
jgi:hypothetical protein